MFENVIQRHSTIMTIITNDDNGMLAAVRQVLDKIHGADYSLA